ncbi:putative GTP pyrophosphokinase [Metabacillus sp. SLBN-84]
MEDFKVPEMSAEKLKTIKRELTRFMMSYKFALEEMNTKINILKQEFQYIHDYSPIEHVSSRLKSPESIMKKMHRKNYVFSLEEIRKNMKDIAGIRITCSFLSDIYQISDMIQNQKDIHIVECKDYIKNPKPNGYQSRHLLAEIPVFMSDRQENVMVEVQIRTIAMDFWASLEHKIYYKYNQAIPEHLTDELREAALSAAELDRKMERLHNEITDLKKNGEEQHPLEEQMLLPLELLAKLRQTRV